eukprot:5705207-Pyramimonas_sp.AAC.1
MVTGALLERQLVVVCPNAGVVCAAVLSLVPMLRPFAWQSVMLPALPRSLLAVLEAPVPFVVGVTHKDREVRAKSQGLSRVNVYKDKVKMAPGPPLPRLKELLAALRPFHERLAGTSYSRLTSC